MSAPIAIDAMGGDEAPDVVVRGALIASARGVPVLLVGREAELAPLLPRRSSIVIVHAADVLGMAESPSAIRRRPDSSLHRTLSLVASGEACAALSCGNTGAVLVGAVVVLGVLQGVERPALATLLPRRDGERLVMLDAGANVDCRPEQLACFALLGAAYAELLGVARPRIGLLSNGEEDGKGNMQVRATLPLLRSLALDVVGNVEPTAALAGVCDVLVCDGFVGNVMLKAVEGASDLVAQVLTNEIQRRASARMGAMLVSGAFKRFRQRLAWEAQSGAMLLGVDGVVAVGHGRTSPEAVAGAAAGAWHAANHGLVAGLAAHLG